MIRQMPLQLLALVLLLPAGVTAESPWDCTRQADGQWVCDSKAPAPEAVLPTTDSNLALPPETREVPVPAATPDTSEPDINAITTGTAGATGQATPAGPPPEPLAADSEPVTTPSATDRIEHAERTVTSPAEAEPPVTAATQAAPAVAETEVDEDYDLVRWALCPPVIRPAPLEEGVGADTINLHADSAQSSGGNVYTLDGNAMVQYGEQRLEADSIIFRQDSNQIEALHGIRFTGPGLYASGESAAIDTETEQGEMRKVNYTLYEQHGRGVAEVLYLDGFDKQHMEAASYTTCPPGNDDWVLSAREVNLDQAEGAGTARNAKLAFKGIPILYTPYASFPLGNRRKSGLLVPKIGQSAETGFDLSVPVYWNIAPDRDMTIIPRHMSDRGTMLGAEFRYLNANNGGSLRGDYLPADKLRDDDYRSLVSFRHNWRPTPRLRTRIIASNASDVHYFEDLGDSLLQTSQTNLERTAAADYSGTWWDMSMMVQDFQTVSPNVPSYNRPYKQLPQIIFNAAPDSRLLGLKVETGAELNHFVHSDGTLVEGSRLDVQPRFSLPVHRAAWYIDPAVSLRHTVYNLNNNVPGADDSPSRTTPIASLDAGTFFDRNGRWGNSSYVQTLEPRLFYLYVPDQNQDDLPVFDTGDYDFNFWTLFRENRFSGPDRMGDANQLALALTSRFLNPESGRQILSASLGSLLYFRDRNVTLPGDPVETDSSSDLIGEVTVALSQRWNADAEYHWNPHDSVTSRNDYRLQYRRGPRQLINLSYRQQRGLLEQTDVSFLWPLSPAWHMVGRWYYSLESSETIEVLGGIGYESCCWGLQLLAQSFIVGSENDRNTSVFLQLELKGLGKLGTTVEDALDRGTLGYEPNY